MNSTEISKFRNKYRELETELSRIAVSRVLGIRPKSETLALLITKFQIGGITTPNVRFVLTQQTLNPLNECWRSDGVFALSWDQWNENWRDSPPGTILKGFDEQELTLLFGGDPTPNGAPADGGWMTFGGKDPDHCDDKWTWLQQGFAIARWDNEFHVTVKECVG